MSIFSSMRYCLGSPDEYSNMWAALAFMPFGLFFDFMDGKVARWQGKSSLMGQELDSLADLVWPCAPSMSRPRLIFGYQRYPSVPHQPQLHSQWASAPQSTTLYSPSSFSADSCVSPASTSQYQAYQKMPLGSQSTSKARLSQHRCQYPHSWHSG